MKIASQKLPMTTQYNNKLDRDTTNIVSKIVKSCSVESCKETSSDSSCSSSNSNSNDNLEDITSNNSNKNKFDDESNNNNNIIINNNNNNNNKFDNESNNNINTLIKPVLEIPLIGVSSKLKNGIHKDVNKLLPKKPPLGQKHNNSFLIRNGSCSDKTKTNIPGDQLLSPKRYKSMPSVKVSPQNSPGLPRWMAMANGNSTELIKEEEDEYSEVLEQREMYSNEEIQRIHTEFCELKKKISLLEKLVRENGLLPPHGTNTSSEPEFTLQQKINRDRVFINIGGIRHETYRSTLKNIPDTRLSWMAEESATHSSEYDPVNGEFFFDRHPQVFSHILNYYRTGDLHVPYDVCGPLFEEELQYWGMDDTQVESCCWTSYRQHRDAQETLKDFEGIEFERDYEDESEPDMAKYGFSVDRDENSPEKTTWHKTWQPKIWKLMEDPHSSTKAKIIAYISMILIMLSVILFCLETIDYFSRKDRKLVLTILEGLCVLYFTAELLIRFIFCPNWKVFLRNVMNWIDLLAIIPFFISTIMVYGFHSENTVTFLQAIRVFRVFRIIKLSKHSVGLQILGHTLKASFRELLLLIFFLAIGIIIFSSLVFYCERNEKETKFINIPATFWWAVITMTTVGYGDMVPTTVLGKIIGGLCSICGVLMIALPVPVIVNNFNLYYSHAQARLKLPKKKRRLLCGAANTLKGPTIEEFERRKQSHSSDQSLPPDDITDRKSEDNSTDDDNNNNEDDGDRCAELRKKRFSRRDSNMFSILSSSGGWNMDISSAPVSIKRNSYALNKRRSLLPTIATLPEIEQ